MSNELDEVKRITQEWLDKQGHDRCWYYPELFRKLAQVLELKLTVEAQLPPEEEFRMGCERYTQEEYHNVLSDKE